MASYKLQLPQSVKYTQPCTVKANVADVDERGRTVTASIATDRVDSDKEVIQIAGLDMGRFDKNPVVLFMHNPECVVGKCNEWRRRKKELIAVTEFAETELGEELLQLYAKGFMRGWSIGMDYGSIQRREISEADVRKRKDWAGARWVIESATVAEYSAVSVPANEDALTLAASKGLIRVTRKWLCPDVEVPAPVRLLPTIDVVRRVDHGKATRQPVTETMIRNEVREAVRYLRGID